MPTYRIQDFEKKPSTFSPLTFGRIYRETFANRDAAIEAARRLLLLHEGNPLFGVRVLDGQGKQAWSSVGEGDRAIGS